MILIYLSGIDGCGKTTQAKLLVDALNQNGVNAEYVWLRWEPSFQILSNAIRSIVAGSLSKNRQKSAMADGNQGTKHRRWLFFKRKILANCLIAKLWLLFASADYFFSYKKHFNKINADVAVLDRYVYDFIIDQAINCDLPPEQMNRIKQTCFLNKFRFPDYTIIIDLPALEGFSRKDDGTSQDYLEVRERFYKSINGQNTLHLNGLEGIDFLHVRAKSWVFKKIGVKNT